MPGVIGLPSYSPYDWNESIQQRNEYIEDRLKDGSPVVALTYDGGLHAAVRAADAAQGLRGL